MQRAARMLVCLVMIGCEAEEAAVDPPQDLGAIEKQLESIGYVNVVPALESNLEGVVHLDPTAAMPGWNLFNSRQESFARIMTLDGQVVHRIGSELRGLAYEQFHSLLPSYLPPYLDGWNHVELTPEGDLLAIANHHALLRLTWDSTLLWKLDIAAHHDLAIAPDGRIYVLTDALRIYAAPGVAPIVFQDNTIDVVTPDGQVVRKISLYDAFRDRPERAIIKHQIARVPAAAATRSAFYRKHAEGAGPQTQRLVELREAAIGGEIETHAETKNILLHGKDEDIFHANSIQVLPSDQPGLWRKGDLLVSLRNLDLLAVIDHLTGLVIWTFTGGGLEAQHDANWLADGTILLFDNGPKRGYSRVLRIDPRRGEIVWEYRGSPPESFFSIGMSGVQALPNGNLLVTVSESGRAFELTPDGQIAWDYLSEMLPAKPNQPPQRGAIWRMTRLPPEAIVLP
jgi:outer membrane protein assembly factor BamB